MQEIKKNIITTCKTLIDEKGVHWISVRKLVDRSGCSLRSLYNKFKNLDEVYLEVMNDFTLDIRDYLKERNQTIPVKDDDLLAIYLSFLTYFLEYPNRFYFMYLFKHEKDPSRLPLFGTPDFQEQIGRSHHYLLENKRYTQDEINSLGQNILYGIFGILTLYFTGNFDMKKEHVIPAFTHFFNQQLK